MKKGFRRVGAFVLLLAMLMTLLPQTAWLATADYTEPYLNQMADWGFMRGDIEGNMNPDNNITRAEFVTIINRAFGYEKMGTTPFTDVADTDWYAEDVSIAYTAGYIKGTSESTFSPLSELTREEATVILSRNLMMQPSVGENTDFTDGRDLSNWSSGLITTAARYNLISGYPDGSFRPQNSITRGEVAIMVTKAVGTPLQEAGDYTLGNVYGNVLVADSGITLRDTTIAGNLYITAGVDLGDVHLQNVTVLGEIVISGGGVSEGGDDSIVLRNVNSPKLILDNINNQQVSLRVEGNGVITTTSVRTDSYVADNTPAGFGLSRIELDGEEGRSLKLAGNVKEVVNFTPKSYIGVAAGVVDTITVDEKATDATLSITAGAQVGNVNLDVGTTVTGDGDIGNLTVNADGSTVSMLPDQIVVRPGVSANIDGEEMDSAAAAEASADPRLMAGYPQITDLAPTSATASFSANKRGTVYWAITSVTDGSVGVDALINPQSYATNIVKQGTVTLGGANQPGTAKISGLTSDGSYYLSTVFVDARSDQSPLKVISFTTPDNTKPDFASGYPYLSQITNIAAQVTAMPTKTCRLYWAVLPKGAAAPTGDDFKANAVTGNLGYGTLDVSKNTEYTFDVNNVPLEELKSYDLYLWLTDIEGGQSSAVKKLSFTTVDKTPPVFNTEPTINKVDKTSVSMYANLNEAGTLFWVVVAQGEEYPKPLAGQSGAVDLASDTAKLQVSAGMNALKSGKVSMTEGKDVTFNVSGLEAEKAYDLYYVAQDKAGNFSATVKKITIHTLDPNAPTVTQEFTKYNGDDVDTPLPNTDIRLVFSEAVQTADTNVTLESLYEDVVKAGATSDNAREKMADFLRNSIQLYVDDGNGMPEVVVEATETTDKDIDEWVIDYRYAEITQEDGKTVVKLPTTSDAKSALNLASGGTYYFQIVANTIADTSSAKNIMGTTKLDKFTTVFAIVNLSNPNESTLDGTITDYHNENKELTLTDADRLVDVSWLLTPTSTESVQDNVNWDMIIWSDTSVAFDLYRRTNTRSATGAWERIGKGTEITVPDGYERRGVSLTRILQSGNNPLFEQLNHMLESEQYEYAIHFTRIGELPDRNTWSQRVTIGVTIVAGSTDALGSLANGALDSESLIDALSNGLMNIGQPDNFTLRKQFSDQTPPIFVDNRPYFEVGDSMVNMYLMLDRPGTIYYVVAPWGTMTTTGSDDNDSYNFSTEEDDYDLLPKRGKNDSASGDMEYPFIISAPSPLSIINASNQSNSRIKYGSIRGGSTEVEKIVEGLDSKTKYIVYFVIQGDSSQVYSPVYAYQFSTADVTPAYITLRAVNPEVEFKTSQNASLYYALYASNRLPSIFTTEKLDGNNLAPEYQTGGSNPAGADITGMTLLQAIQKTIDGTTGESYFDRYASTEIKEQVRLAITSQTSSEALAKGEMTGLEMGRPESYDFTSAMNPESATAYLCLATAQNELGGIWTFKAVDGVRIPDEEAPVLDTVTTQATASKNGVSGTVILTFTETLYHINDDGNPDSLRPIVQRTGDMSSWVGFLNITVNGEGNLTPPLSSSISPTRTFIFNFKDLPVGYTFTFPSSGELSDASSNTIKGNVYTLQLQETKGIGLVTGGVGYEFKVLTGIMAENQ